MPLPQIFSGCYTLIMQRTQNCFVLNEKLHLHLLLSTPKQKDMVKKAEIVSVIKKAGDSITQLLPLQHVNILFSFGKRVIPETGESGFASGPGLIRLSVDPAHKDGLEFVVKKRLPKALAQELHHAARMVMVDWGKTLLEALVSEGLADNFSDKLYPKPSSPWTNALTSKEERAFWMRAKQALHKKYSHSEWFFGRGEIPRWAGYSIGYRLVQDAIENLDKSAAELVQTPVPDIYKASGWGKVKREVAQ